LPGLIVEFFSKRSSSLVEVLPQTHEYVKSSAPQPKANSKAGMANKSIANHDRPVDRRVSVGRSRLISIELTRYPKRTLCNQYSRKYIKIIHQLFGDVYCLVLFAMADHRLARQMTRRRRNMCPYYCVTIMIQA